MSQTSGAELKGETQCTCIQSILDGRKNYMVRTAMVETLLQGTDIWSKTHKRQCMEKDQC